MIIIKNKAIKLIIIENRMDISPKFIFLLFKAVFVGNEFGAGTGCFSVVDEKSGQFLLKEKYSKKLTIYMY